MNYSNYIPKEATTSKLKDNIRLFRGTYMVPAPMTRLKVMVSTCVSALDFCGIGMALSYF